jgi:hypothetical protein
MHYLALQTRRGGGGLALACILIYVFILCTSVVCMNILCTALCHRRGEEAGALLSGDAAIEAR